MQILLTSSIVGHNSMYSRDPLKELANTFQPLIPDGLI